MKFIITRTQSRFRRFFITFIVVQRLCLDRNTSWGLILQFGLFLGCFLPFSFISQNLSLGCQQKQIYHTNLTFLFFSIWTSLSATNACERYLCVYFVLSSVIRGVFQAYCYYEEGKENFTFLEDCRIESENLWLFWWFLQINFSSVRLLIKIYTIAHVLILIQLKRKLTRNNFKFCMTELLTSHTTNNATRCSAITTINLTDNQVFVFCYHATLTQLTVIKQWTEIWNSK